MPRLAQVVRVNSTRRTVDLVYVDNNEPVREALVLGKASSVGGGWDVPSMPPPSSQQQAGQVPPTGRSMLAVVHQIGRRAVVLGFVPDFNNQVAFKDPDRQVDLHPSGVLQSIDQVGNIQIQHPGGLTVRIGSSQIENLDDVAVAPLTLPTQAAPTVTVSMGTAWSMTIDPAGNITVTTQKAAVVNAQTATVMASQSATITAPMVSLGVASGGKRVVVDGDPVSGNAVHAQGNTHVYAG